MSPHLLLLLHDTLQMSHSVDTKERAQPAQQVHRLLSIVSYNVCTQLSQCMPRIQPPLCFSHTCDDISASSASSGVDGSPSPFAGAAAAARAPAASRL